MLRNNKIFKYNTSVCITTFNEKKEDVNMLLLSLNKQSLKPDEVIIIDAKDYNNCSRSEGRNIAIKKSKNEIIAITDVGCTLHKDWLKNITKPLFDKKCDVVAGGYEMIYRNPFEKAESIFLGVNTKGMNNDFMPSARSMAFTKSIWKKAGGFPENLKATAEDTIFNLNLIKAGAKFNVVKKAICYWHIPDNIYGFFSKIKNYAKGDAESGIWWHPIKKFKTHNIKVLTIFMRYILGFTLLFIDVKLFLMYFLLYVIYACYKASFWGIILQFVADFACIIGFSHGILSNSSKRS